MTREEVYSACETALTKSNVLLLEAATGFGKTLTSIRLINWIAATHYKNRRPKILLLVAKRVHKQTWNKEFLKWGGIQGEVIMECYESLHKHMGESFDIILMDEVHHVGSDLRLEALKTMKYSFMIGLSATIPRNLKSYFKFWYHAETVTCDIIEAIDSEVLPEPEILLFPLQLDNTLATEEWEINSKTPGPVVHDIYANGWKYRKSRQHVILSCTKKQKSNEFNSEILYWKRRWESTHNEAVKQLWLYKCGQRLEYYANIKIPVIRQILKALSHHRTITFCKTISQCERVGRWCIHSKNGKLADKFYNNFNQKKINHITAVNILNENANLVDCKYGIFDNLSSSDIVVYQRLGKL